VADLPKSPGAVANIMTDIVSLAFSWVEASKAQAPSSTLILLQDFTSRLQKHCLPGFSHVGVSLGLNVATKPSKDTAPTSSTTEARPSLGCLKESGGSEFVGDLDCTSHFLGEIAGMAAMHACSASSDKFGHTMKMMLVDHYKVFS
jgi:hypothetical protein